MMLDYQTQAENDSMYNTPPCWSMYICGLVFAYMLQQGGLAGALQRNEQKAKVCCCGLISKCEQHKRVFLVHGLAMSTAMHA